MIKSIQSLFVFPLVLATALTAAHNTADARPARIRVAAPEVGRSEAFVAKPKGPRPKTPLSRTKFLQTLKTTPVHTDKFTVDEVNLLGAAPNADIHVVAVTRTVSNEKGHNDYVTGRKEIARAVVGITPQGISKFMSRGTVRAKTAKKLAVAEYNEKKDTSHISVVQTEGVTHSYVVDGNVEGAEFVYAQGAERVYDGKGDDRVASSGEPVLRVAVRTKTNASATIYLSAPHMVETWSESGDSTYLAADPKDVADD